MPAKHQHIIVVGAGAFGGWTALSLLRAGARVTLFEAREAGNPLSSSGGESRVIRHACRSRLYVDMARRAMELWKAYDQRGNRALFCAQGVLFMSHGGSGHGLKHGPAIGELVAANVMGTRPVVQRFSLDRFGIGPAKACKNV